MFVVFFFVADKDLEIKKVTLSYLCYSYKGSEEERSSILEYRKKNEGCEAIFGFFIVLVFGGSTASFCDIFNPF